MERKHAHETLDQLAYIYASTILGFTPNAYARMQEAGATKKYLKVYQPLSHSGIFAHLRGDITVATSLIDQDGQARATVLDIDTGGREALVAVLKRAEVMGLTAFAQTSTNEEHDGGHIWILFEKPTEPERLRYLGQHLADGTGIEAESYPTKKAIRLPLGKHTWTNKRGTLVFQNGDELDLDVGLSEVAGAITKIAELPRNSLSLLPPLPEASKHASQSSPEASRQGSGANPIHEYNQNTDLLEFVLRAGGRIAQEYQSGRVLIHCPCGNHKHGDARPSLELQPARNTARYGKYVAVGHAQGCLFYTERGQVIDAFSAYCKLEHVTPHDAVKELTEQKPRTPRNPREPKTKQSEKQITEEKDEPHRERRNEAEALHAELRERANSDCNLSQRAKQVLETLLSIAGKRSWCRPSIARLSAMLDLCRRTVYRAIADLEIGGYIESEAPTGATTTIRRFLTGSHSTGDSMPKVEAHVSPVLELDTSTNLTLVVTCEPPRLSNSTAESSQEAPGATEQGKPVVEDLSEAGAVVSFVGGASYTPPPDLKIRIQMLNLKSKRQKNQEQHRRQLAKWKAMEMHELERERYVLLGAQRKSKSERQRVAFDYMLKDLDHEIGKRRDRGMRVLYEHAEIEGGLTSSYLS